MRLAFALLVLVIAVPGAAEAQRRRGPRAEITLPDAPLDLPPPLAPVAGGLTADDAAERAVRLSPSVRMQAAASARFGAIADDAAGGFVPRFDFVGSYNRTNRLDLPPLTIGGFPPMENPFTQVLDLWAVRATAIVPLSDYFLTILPAWEAAQGFAEAAQYRIELERHATAYRAKEAFYGHLRARVANLVAEEAIANLEEASRDAQALVANGMRPRAEYAQVTASLAQARAAQAQARAALAVTEETLRRLLDLEDGAAIGVGEDLYATALEPTPDRAALLREALENRPESRALRAAIRGREAAVRARVGNTLPRISLNGYLETSSPNLRVIPQSTEIYTTWMVGAAVSWSPNDLGNGLNRIRQAEAELAESREEFEVLHDAVAVEVMQAVMRHQSALESIAAGREGLAAADVALTDRRSAFRLGVSSSTELLQSQLDRSRAQMTLVDAYVELALARAGLRRVRGEMP